MSNNVQVKYTLIKNMTFKRTQGVVGEQSLLTNSLQNHKNFVKIILNHKNPLTVRQCAFPLQR